MSDYEGDLLSSFESDILSDSEDDNNINDIVDIDSNFTQGLQDSSLPAIENDSNSNIENLCDTLPEPTPPPKRKRISYGENGNLKKNILYECISN